MDAEDDIEPAVDTLSVVVSVTVDVTPISNTKRLFRQGVL